MVRQVALLITLCLLALSAGADELRPGYLQIKQTADQDFSVTFKTPARGADQRLSIYAEFDDSVSPVGNQLQGILDGAHVSNWRIRGSENLAGTRIHIKGLQQTNTDVLLRIEYLDGRTQVHQLSAASPSITLPASQSWVSIATNYLWLGIEHILIGLDHLLFVAALMMLVSGWRKLVATITAFTFAHSITLILSTLDVIRFPIPPVEAVIALSIVFVASEVVRKQQGHDSLSNRRPWLVAFSFGLLHGLGFAAVLQDIGLPENALATALILFNVGVEIGQLVFVAALLVAWKLFGAFYPSPSPVLARVPAYLIGVTATFWVIERTASFWQI